MTLLNKAYETFSKNQYSVFTLEVEGYEDHHIANCVAGGKDALGCAMKASNDQKTNTIVFPHKDFTGIPVTAEVHAQISSLVDSPSKKVISHCTGGTGRTAYGLGLLMLNSLSKDA